MLHLALRRGGFCLELGRHWNCQLRPSSSRIPLQTLPKEEPTNNDTEDLTKSIQSIAIPVKILPDSTKTEQLSEINVIPDIKNTTTTFNIDDASQIKENGQKKVERLPWQVTPSLDKSKLLQQYLKLSKFRLSSLVVITSMAGYAMAPAPFDWGTFILCSVGTGLTSGAANAVNQYHEVPFDSQMSRTKNRVLVTGQVTQLHAIGFALTSATIGITTLYYGCNPLTAALGFGNLILYTSIYTPMKRYSILNTWVGSIVGAIPPLMGWAACAGTLDYGSLILAGLLYAWQFPHFNALSWNLRPDYSRAGYRMMAVTNPGLCRRTALRYTIIVGALSLIAPVLDVTNQWFALETLPLNAYFAYLAWKFYQKSDSGSSRKLFRFSLIHLPALMMLFLLNKKHWIYREQTELTPGNIANVIPLAPIAETFSTTTKISSPTIKNDSFDLKFGAEKLNSLQNSERTLTKILPVTVAASVPTNNSNKSTTAVVNNSSPMNSTS